MPFSPDNSHQMNNDQVGWVKVPNGCRAEFTFSSKADWENAVCIYPQNSDEKLFEAGNHSRKLDIPFATPENNNRSDVWYRVTAWHKCGTPNASLPWIQSAVREEANSGTNYTYGFEDAGQDDYDDMVVNVRIKN